MFSNDSLVIGINDYHDINIIKNKINNYYVAYLIYNFNGNSFLSEYEYLIYIPCIPENHEFPNNLPTNSVLYKTNTMSHKISTFQNDSDVIMSTYHWGNDVNFIDIEEHFSNEIKMYDFVSFNEIQNNNKSNFFFIGSFSKKEGVQELYEGKNVSFLKK
ncbi:hypothetical protein ACS65S_13390 [Staphylococcus saprophyticus]